MVFGRKTGNDLDFGAIIAQLDKVRHLAGVEIAWNEVINEPGNSAVEDNISIYLSSGTPQSPIRIHDNFIRGAFPISAGLIFQCEPSAYADWGVVAASCHLGRSQLVVALKRFAEEGCRVSGNS